MQKKGRFTNEGSTQWKGGGLKEKRLGQHTMYIQKGKRELGFKGEKSNSGSEGFLLRLGT